MSRIISKSSVLQTGRNLFAVLMTTLIFSVVAEAVMAQPVSTNVTKKTTADTTTVLAHLLAGKAPKSVDDLKIMQERIKRLTKRVTECTVFIQVGRANGSGVIISEDGYVLTAAHVASEALKPARLRMADGSLVQGETLGFNQKLDAGLVRITEPGKWPFAKMGRSSKTKPGQWCLATGHPGGYQQDRKPVLRLGRVLKSFDSAILTDCTLIGGDSGGPLFDINGRVIGIHSRIGKDLSINVHVPVDNYRSAWDRYVRGDSWDFIETQAPWIGVKEDLGSDDARIADITPGSPAELVGMQVGDVITEFEGLPVNSFSKLKRLVRKKEVGDLVTIRVRRNLNDIYEFELKIGNR